MKFSRKVGNGPANRWLNFGGDPDHRLDTGLLSRFVTVGRYAESASTHSFILIRQMGGLISRYR